MEPSPYKQALQEAIKKLMSVREELFDAAFQVAITGELKEWSDTVEEGETFTIAKEVLTGCDDQNVRLLTALVTHVEQTCESLLNLNNLEVED